MRMYSGVGAFCLCRAQGLWDSLQPCNLGKLSNIIELHFFLCKTELIITVPTSQDCCMDLSVYKEFKSLWQLNENLIHSCDSLCLCWERK